MGRFGKAGYWMALCAFGFWGIDSAQIPSIRFTDVTREVGVNFKQENSATSNKYLIETMGGGVAFLDYDNDGRLDIFFVNGAYLADPVPEGKLPDKSDPKFWNRLFHQTPDGTFTDVTEGAGLTGMPQNHYGMGVAVGDYDNDGFLDIYVTGFGGNTLYHNNRNGTFTDVTARAGVRGSGWSSSAGWFDYDRDGFLDLFVVRYLDYDPKKNPYCGLRKEGHRMYCDPRNFDGLTNLLYHNNGDGTFTEVSKAAGVANPAGKGLGVAFGDFNNDGWPDIFVSNDTVRNFLYLNNGDGTFTDIAYAAGAGYDANGRARAGMGVEMADFDGDGLLDLFVTNFSEEYYGLYRNLGNNTFEDVAQKVGLGSSFLRLGFGTKLFDFDNDGQTDIYVTNGHVTDNVELYRPALSYMQTDLLYNNENAYFRDGSS